MSRSVALAIETAQLHLRYGNPGDYARCLFAEHRAQTWRQQRAIEAVIAADATSHLFTRHPENGCSWRGRTERWVTNSIAAPRSR